LTRTVRALRVVEIADEISGPYCAKLLVDLGAEVTKVEPPNGDPMRRWGPFPGGIADPDRSGLFDYLNAGKRCVTADLSCERDVAMVAGLIGRADVLVDGLAPGALAGYGLGDDRLQQMTPRPVAVRISNFGRDGPLRERAATPLTMQAASGWISVRDPDRAPVQAGARIPEYVAGAYAALGALTALRIRPGDDVVDVDVSVLESLLGSLLGLPEYGAHQIAIMLGGPERAEFFAAARPWLAGHTVAEITELGQALRIPTGPVADGATALRCPQYVERAFFVDGGGAGWSFRRPGSPFRFSKPSALAAPAGPAADPALPFAGMKVLDLTTFWAGAYLTCYLGAFGADVVKVESVQRPDGHRYSGAYPHEGDDWYERSALWQATNLNKRDITLDLTSRRGRELVRRLARECDVVVENFSPRVVEQFGLDYESLAALRPDVILLRMPGFGLDGPWRDYVGWALNIEQVSGMSAVTGYADGPPCNIAGPADPLVGVHAGVALLAALEHRRRSGEGQLIEIAQIEVGAAVAAEPVIEYSMNGRVRPREGNRQRGYRQGVYPTRTDGAWVALSVRDDGDWRRLSDAMGRADTLEDDHPAGAHCAGAHDAFDDIVAAWTRTLAPAEIVTALQSVNIPAEEVLVGERMYELPQLQSRGYYEEFEHPVTGARRYPGWPFRITGGPVRHHRFPPPTLGQHNDEVLRGLGVSTDELAALRRSRVIGERLPPTS
jgi:crotonobetainyl-CoA:carnitine CoA-transferase CaiB-like acyl-CoA transferase